MIMLDKNQEKQIEKTEQMIDMFQDYFRNIEDKDSDNLFTLSRKQDKIKKLTIDRYVRYEENFSKLPYEELQRELQGKNVVIALNPRATMFNILIKQKLVIYVNTIANYIGVRLYDIHTTYGEDILYVASKQVNSKLFIQTLLDNIKGQTPKGDTK